MFALFSLFGSQGCKKKASSQVSDKKATKAAASLSTPEKSVLHIYTWADYMNPDLIDEFEKQHDCIVKLEFFESNEAMYDRLKEGPYDYDLLFPSSYMAKMLWEEGMIEKINHSLIENLSNLDSDYLAISEDKDMVYSVPYMLSNTGIAYLKSKCSDVQPSWSMFEREDLRGNMAMLNDLREVLGAALKSLGYSLNTRNEDELAQAKEVALRWKKNLSSFDSDSYVDRLVSGELWLVQAYSGDILQRMEEHEDIAFVMPREGISIACDDMVIPKNANQSELAHRMIHFLHNPLVAAKNTDYIGYLCPNKNAYSLMSDDVLSNPAVFLDPEIRAKSEVIDDVGEAKSIYESTWKEIYEIDE